MARMRHADIAVEVEENGSRKSRKGTAEMTTDPHEEISEQQKTDTLRRLTATTQIAGTCGSMLPVKPPVPSLLFKTSKTFAKSI